MTKMIELVEEMRARLNQIAEAEHTLVRALGEALSRRRPEAAAGRAQHHDEPRRGAAPSCMSCRLLALRIGAFPAAREQVPEAGVAGADRPSAPMQYHAHHIAALRHSRPIDNPASRAAALAPGRQQHRGRARHLFQDPLRGRIARATVDVGPASVRHSPSAGGPAAHRRARPGWTSSPCAAGDQAGRRGCRPRSRCGSGRPRW